MNLAIRRLLIWGAGGHAKVVADVARANGLEIAGFLDETEARHSHAFYGSHIVGGSRWLTSPEGDRACEVFVAIGDNMARLSGRCAFAATVASKRKLRAAVESGVSSAALIGPFTPF